jgi:hypothetical protein
MSTIRLTRNSVGIIVYIWNKVHIKWYVVRLYYAVFLFIGNGDIYSTAARILQVFHLHNI